MARFMCLCENDILSDVEYECDKEAVNMFLAIFYGTYDDNMMKEFDEKEFISREI